MKIASLNAICASVLNDGRGRFNAMLGIVSRVQDGEYEVFAVSSDTGIPYKGDTAT
jgi:hypothetical protein